MSSTSCLNNPCPEYTTGLGAQSFLAAIGSLLVAQCQLTEDWPPDGNVNDGDYFDFIIVGAGSAGCVVANRLTEVPHWRVLVIEAGPDPPLESVVPALSTFLWKTKYDWQYFAETKNKYQEMDPPNIQYWPRGKMLGGSGSINGMVYIRGNSNDYNSWAEAGNFGWDWPTVREYFKKSENFNDDLVSSDSNLSTFHSKGGLLDVQHFRGANIELSNALIGALAEIGLPPLLDLNGPTQFGSARLHATTVNGRRASPATAFLNPAAQRPNLYVLKDTLAIKILFSACKSFARGIEVEGKSGETFRFYATKEVIISAGTVNSPQLLMLSGIGPKEHLQSLGIPVIADLPVGKNLHDHFFVPVIFVGDNGKPITQLDNVIEVVKYLVDQTGSLSTASQPDVSGFFSVTDEQQYPDIQILSNLFPANFESITILCELFLPKSACDIIKVMNKDHQLYMLLVGLINVKSEGRILLQTNNPKDHPLINANSLGNIEDLEKLVKGCIKITELVNTTIFKSMGAVLGDININQCADLEFLSDSYWKCISYNIGSPGLHPTGSVKMGKLCDKTAVVDNRLRVHGIKKLRVIDCSIMPTQPSGNTNAPAMMVGERASDFIKEDYCII